MRDDKAFFLLSTGFSDFSFFFAGGSVCFGFVLTGIRPVGALKPDVDGGGGALKPISATGEEKNTG